MIFETIDYLQNGNDRQQRVYEMLVRHQVMKKLADFDPILVGTIPIEVDIETSDLDIICCFSDPQVFNEVIFRNFGTQNGFTLKNKLISGVQTVVSRFELDEFQWEIFGQAIPTFHQMGYRHLVIEYHLLHMFGEEFRQRIVALKRSGYKTEPAFARLLNLSGDPYQALLRYETKEHPVHYFSDGSKA